MEMRTRLLEMGRNVILVREVDNLAEQCSYSSVYCKVNRGRKSKVLAGQD